MDANRRELTAEEAYALLEQHSKRLEREIERVREQNARLAGLHPRPTLRVIPGGKA